MLTFLTYAFLFFLGSVGGWVLELFFRKFLSASNPGHKWINPGFCVGPYVPLYGFGLCISYAISQAFAGSRLSESIPGTALMLLLMTAGMTGL